MTGGAGDWDRHAARDPRTSPHQLAELAARRWDLHAVIAANPQTYPALRQWMASVSPRAMAPQPAPVPQGHRPAPGHYQPHGHHPVSSHHPGQGGYPVARPPQRRRGAGGWVLGGCLTFVVIMVVVLAGSGALLASDDSGSPTADPSAPTADPSGSVSTVVEEQMAIYEAERQRYYELAAQLDGNPAAPLVLRPAEYARLEGRAEQIGPTDDFSAQTIAQEAQRRREDLQSLVDLAAQRRVNSTGSLSEQLVDDAGDGFIDIQWDAETACGTDDRPDWRTTGCVTKEDSLTVHFLAESEYSSEWEIRMFVAHELTHVYQRADGYRFDDNVADADRLIEQGLFQGSEEKMADCYALTYYDEWTLETAETVIGYGYVCNESERDAIRTWAADINAPMPG